MERTRRENEKGHRPFPWGTVSAEILQPSTQTLFYCYGWPCGEKPEYRDQLYQEHSWGEFKPFKIEANAFPNQTKILTTIQGAF